MSEVARPSGPADAEHEFLDQEQDDGLLTPAEAASYLRLSKSWLDKSRVYGGGPPFYAPTQRKILYRRSDLDAWIRKRRFTSTSEYSRKRSE